MLMPMPMPMHLPVITVTRHWRDGFTKRYWLRCFECSETGGPYHSFVMAQWTFESFAMLRCPQDSRAYW